MASLPQKYLIRNHSLGYRNEYTMQAPNTIYIFLGALLSTAPVRCNYAVLELESAGTMWCGFSSEWNTSYSTVTYESQVKSRILIRINTYGIF